MRLGGALRRLERVKVCRRSSWLLRLGWIGWLSVILSRVGADRQLQLLLDFQMVWVLSWRVYLRDFNRPLAARIPLCYPKRRYVS
jgi:hypothetical protein